MIFRIIRSIFAVAVLALFVYAPGSVLAEDAGSGYMTNLIENIKKTVVFIGKKDLEGEPQYIATGFLIQVQDVFHIVTAKHVIVNKITGKYQDEDFLVFFDLKSGGIAARSIKELKEQYGVDWVFHENKEVDIAMMPFRLNPEKDDVRVIPDNLFLTPDHVFELDDAFFLSYQPGIEQQKEIMPVIRSGTIGMVSPDGIFYLDAFAFPGNSGSPVFLKPSPIRYRQDGKGISVYGKGDPLGGKFIGMIGDYLPYRDVAVSAQTGQPRIVFEENTGLSRVWSVIYLQEIMASKEFKEQLNKLK